MHLNRGCRGLIGAIAQLTVFIDSPRPDRTVFFQGNGMELTRSDFSHAIHDFTGAFWNRPE